MALKTHCEKCGQRLRVETGYGGHPERLKCWICGFSIWFPPNVTMKGIPPKDNKFAPKEVRG